MRKHGVRFGQFTIFMPLLLKPAPTRLRLVLWSLAQGHDTFAEAPPPGLVTVPADAGTSQDAFMVMGYRRAGSRAIRIDMLERLADMLRGEDTRGGFEAKADMLSITGLTLEQFADLMEGLGYRAEKGERAKEKAVDQVVPTDEGAAHQAAVPATGAAEGAAAADTPVFDAGQPDAVEPGAMTAEDTPDPASDAVEAITDHGEAPIAAEPAQPQDEAPVAEVAAEETPVGTAPDADVAGPEMEVFYTFTWVGNRQRGGGGRPQGKGRGGPPKGKGKPKGKARGGPGPSDKAKSYQARPEKKDKIDPDNPFAAALQGFKGKS